MNKYLNIFYKPYWKTHNYLSWLYSVYSNEMVSEYDFYFDRFSNDEHDYSRPHYNVWQCLIYKNIKSTFKLTNKNIKSILNYCGVYKINILDKYKFSIETNNTFNEHEFNEIINFYGYKKSNNIYKLDTYKYVTNKQNRFYYITHSSAFNKIKKYGIISSLIESNYPRRIYLWDTKTDINEIKNFGESLNRFYNRNIDDIIILEIEIPKNININLYKSNHSDGYFTLEPIRTSWIKNLKQKEHIKFNSNVIIDNLNNSIEIKRISTNH